MHIKRITQSLSAILIASLFFSGLAFGDSRATARDEAAVMGEPGDTGIRRGRAVVSEPVLPAKTAGLPPAPTIPALDLAPGIEPPTAPLRPYLRPSRTNNAGPPESPGLSQDPLVQAQDQAATSAMPGLSVSFQGINNLDSYFPPDPSGAVGKNHFVQMVNVSTKIFDKQGNPLYGPFHPSDLWPYPDPCNVMNDGDVVVLYDQLADRWLLTQFGVSNWPNGTNYYQCIAVSKGPAPTNKPSDWYPYTFLVHVNNMNDYPKLSVWPDGYYMTANQFEGFTWAGVGIWVFERDKMLAGQAATFQYQDLLGVGLDLYAALPANLLGLQEPPAGSPDYALTVEDGTYYNGPPKLFVLEVAAQWPGGMTVAMADELQVAPFSWLQGDIPQPGAAAPDLDAISDRLMMHAYYRNMGSYEMLTANHTVDAGGGRAGIRWYELRKYTGQAHWQIYQQGTYAPSDTIYRWMGSLASDHQGNLAMGYSVSGTSVYPGIRYAGRLASDPPGTMAQTETAMIAGGGYQKRTQDGIGRWGDYSAMSVDPVDDCTFWYTNEYMPSTGTQPWSTWIGAFKFPGCVPVNSGTITGLVTDAGSGDPLAGASLHGTSSQPGRFFQATSGTDGVYSVHAPEAVYTMTASAFGYWPKDYSGVIVSAGTTTTQNVTLVPVSMHTLSGTVRDLSTGWPLYARVQIDGYPGPALWTDPQNGSFSVILPEFVSYTLQVEAFSAGYLTSSLPIGQLTADVVIDIDLLPDLAACSAPGYMNGAGCQAQDGGLVTGNVTDANTHSGLNGATVSVAGGETVLAAATPNDPAVVDGFYIVFSTPGSQPIQAAYSQYTSKTEIVSVAVGEVTRQDFALPAGHLSVQPPALSATANLGEPVTLPLMLNNTGSAPAQFSITERDSAFAPAILAFRRSFNPPLENTDNNNSTRHLQAPAGTGIKLQQIDLTAITSHQCLLGIEYALGSYWVTSGGQSSCSDPNYLFQISPEGQVISMVAQPDLFSTYGWEDLAFDGTWLYASYSNLIQQINPVTGQVTGVAIPAPVNPVRALAYDPASDHFWVANQASGIYEIDREGNTIQQIPSLLNIYGLAYDPDAPGGPALWVWSQDGIPQVLANRIDPQTGEVLASFSGVSLSGLDQAGGLTFSDSLLPGKRVLLAMHQAASDNAVAYDLDPVYQTDLPWLAAVPASGTVNNGNALPLSISLQSDRVGVLKADFLIDNNSPYGTLTIPVTYTVTGMTLTTPSLTRSALPGSIITYEMTLTNGFPISDTFSLSLEGSSYPTDLSQVTIDLGDWQAGSFQVLVHVPEGAANGDQDRVTITAASQENPPVQAAVILVTKVFLQRIYLPTISNNR